MFQVNATEQYYYISNLQLNLCWSANSTVSHYNSNYYYVTTIFLSAVTLVTKGDVLNIITFLYIVSARDQLYSLVHTGRKFLTTYNILIRSCA